MSPLDKISLDVSIVLGRSRMPIHQLLRMGRGAVIELDSHDDDEVEILANDMPVARGVLVVTGSQIAVEIKDLLRRPTGITAATLAVEAAQQQEAASGVQPSASEEDDAFDLDRE